MATASNIDRLISDYKLCNRLRKRAGQLCAVLLVIFAEPDLTLFVAGFPIIVLGEAIRIWAQGHIRKDAELATEGPYRFVRHPLYLGSFLIASGFLTIAGNIYLTLILPPMLYLYARMIRIEENILWIRFGKTLEEYVSKVGRVIPSLKGADLSSIRGKKTGFDIRNIFAEREYNAVFGIVIIILLLFAKEIWYK